MCSPCDAGLGRKYVSVYKVIELVVEQKGAKGGSGYGSTLHGHFASSYQQLMGDFLKSWKIHYIIYILKGIGFDPVVDLPDY